MAVTSDLTCTGLVPLVLRDDPGLVRRGERTPARPRRRIDSHHLDRGLAHRLIGRVTAAHGSSPPMPSKPNPEARGVSHKTDREGRGSSGATGQRFPVLYVMPSRLNSR